MLSHDIVDKAFINLIKKWLKAGIMKEDGIIEKSYKGTPQGGVITPILANIYLHYILDIWFEIAIILLRNHQIDALKAMEEEVNRGERKMFISIATVFQSSYHGTADQLL